MKQTLPAIPLTPADLDELDRLLAAATPGPWRERIETHESTTFGHSRVLVQIRGPDGSQILVTESRPADDCLTDDARLACALRNAAPALLDAADERDRLRAALQALVDCPASHLGCQDHIEFHKAGCAACEAVDAYNRRCRAVDEQARAALEAKQPETADQTEPVTRMANPLPIGATCTHPKMRCPNGINGCGKACGHWWCPDCGVSWDEGFEGT